MTRRAVVGLGGWIPSRGAARAVCPVIGHLIDHGGGLTDALVFGRRAGAHAAGTNRGDH